MNYTTSIQMYMTLPRPALKVQLALAELIHFVDSRSLKYEKAFQANQRDQVVKLEELDRYVKREEPVELHI